MPARGVRAVLLLFGFTFMATGAEAQLHWEKLPPIPDREGFASPFAGTSNGALIVAGGANFPDKRPWEGGTKTWYDGAYVLDPAAGSWKGGFRLPHAVAYGVSVTTDDGVICIGGGDATRHFRDVLRLSWDGKSIHTSALPGLPRPCAFMCGAVVGKTLYITGGIEKPDAVECMDTFWSLDLANAKAQWQEMQPPAGSPPRMLSVAGSAGGSFYRFSGARLSPGPDGKPVREYLRDAWRFTPSQGWRRLADLPRPCVAAPSPAPVSRGGHLLVISGDDGANIHFKPESAHPGFPRDVLAYDPVKDAWRLVGSCPFSRGTVPTAYWRDRYVIPNGEARPGYRSNEVWSLRIEDLP